jgi:hypothetical protein
VQRPDEQLRNRSCLWPPGAHHADPTLPIFADPAFGRKASRLIRPSIRPTDPADVDAALHAGNERPTAMGSTPADRFCSGRHGSDDPDPETNLMRSSA